jgi:hypothetical protein
MAELKSERLEQDALYQWLETRTPSQASENSEEAIHKNIAMLFRLKSPFETPVIPSKTIRAACAYAFDEQM